MAILNLSCISFTTPQIIQASLSSSSSSSSSSNEVPTPNARKVKVKLNQTKQPSVMEIERAIGAGIFRDRDVDSEDERKSMGKDVEKKLRETGTWLDRLTITTSRSAGKGILKVMFIWILPLWMAAFLVASGIIQLPFLQDLVS